MLLLGAGGTTTTASAAELSCARTEQLTIDYAVVGVPYDMDFGTACLTQGDQLANVSVNWGDGTQSAGTTTYTTATVSVAQAAGQSALQPATLADVSAVHTFHRATGSEPLSDVQAGVPFSVTATDEPSGMPAAPYCGCELRVIPADSLRSATVHARAGRRFSGVIAGLKRYGSPAASGLTATIGWGDGATSSETLRPGAPTIIIAGTHTWRRPGRPRISVVVSDPVGPQRLRIVTPATVRA